MACYPWHYFKTNYVVIIILVVSIISFNLAWQYYGGVDVKNAAIDPENSSDTKKEEIIIEETPPETDEEGDEPKERQTRFQLRKP